MTSRTLQGWYSPSQSSLGGAAICETLMSMLSYNIKVRGIPCQSVSNYYPSIVHLSIQPGDKDFYNGLSKVNYSDPVIQDRIIGNITMLAKKYDGDHDVGAFQVSIVGDEGTWLGENVPPEDVQELILQAYEQFNKTQVILPKVFDKTRPGFGRWIRDFNDFTVHETSPDVMNIAEQTQNYPVNTTSSSTAENAARIEEYTKYLRENNVALIYNTTIKSYANGDIIQQRFGPDIYLTTAQYTFVRPDEDAETGDLNITVTVVNNGTMRFWYDWEVWFGMILVSSSTPKRQARCETCKLSEIQPGEEVTWSQVIRDVEKAQWDQRYMVGAVRAISYNTSCDSLPHYFYVFDNDCRQSSQRYGWCYLPEWYER